MLFLTDGEVGVNARDIEGFAAIDDNFVMVHTRTGKKYTLQLAVSDIIAAINQLQV